MEGDRQEIRGVSSTGQVRPQEERHVPPLHGPGGLPNYGCAWFFGTASTLFFLGEEALDFYVGYFLPLYETSFSQTSQATDIDCTDLLGPLTPKINRGITSTWGMNYANHHSRLKAAIFVVVKMSVTRSTSSAGMNLPRACSVLSPCVLTMCAALSLP